MWLVCQIWSSAEFMIVEFVQGAHVVKVCWFSRSRMAGNKRKRTQKRVLFLGWQDCHSKFSSMSRLLSINQLYIYIIIYKKILDPLSIIFSL